jgi:hypothetical protein
MQSAAIKMSQLYSVEALQKRASLLKWASCCLLCCAGAALLFAHFFADSMQLFLNIALYLSWVEFAVAGIRWGLWEDNWPSLVGGGWLLACTLGVWDFSGHLYCPEAVLAPTAYFLWLLLLGYLALRGGMAMGAQARSFASVVEKICVALSPEHLAKRSFRYSLVALGVCSCLGICYIYAHFGSVPLFSDNPPLARYQFFNGPFTKNLFRFAFRVFSAVSMVASMYLVMLMHKDLSVSGKIASVFTVAFTMLCVLASGSRGDFSVLLLFIGIRVIFLWPAKKRLVPALMACFVCIAAFCAVTVSRVQSGLDSLSLVFSEISDAALLTQSARIHEVPLAWGKTYLSALLSFVPSSVFPFREAYGFGRYSLGIFYLGREAPIAATYGGLRPTFVGEAFLNGGLVGVLLFGLALGAILGTWKCRQGTIKRLSGGWVMFFLLSLLTVMVSDFYGIFHGVLLVACSVWGVEKMLKRFAS